MLAFENKRRFYFKQADLVFIHPLRTNKPDECPATGVERLQEVLGTGEIRLARVHGSSVVTFLARRRRKGKCCLFFPHFALAEGVKR